VRSALMKAADLERARTTLVGQCRRDRVEWRLRLWQPARPNGWAQVTFAVSVLQHPSGNASESLGPARRWWAKWIPSSRSMTISFR